MKACVLAVTVLAVCAPRAHAGSYDVWSCRGPEGRPAGTGAWAPAAIAAAPGDVVFDDTCAQGGELSVTLARGRAFDRSLVGLWAFVAPAGTRITAYELWRSLAVAAPEPGRDFEYTAVVIESTGGATLGAYGCATSALDCRSAGDPQSPLSSLNRVGEHDRPLDALALQVGCQIDACDAPLAPPARMELYRSRIVLDDPAPPADPRLSGTLTGPDAVSGAGTLVVGATDRGGGIAAVTLAIDGGPAQVSASSSDACRLPYTAAQPCPTEAQHAFSVDTSTLADGRHTVRGAVVDAAGNATPWGPVAFAVRHPAPRPNDPPPVEPAPRRNDPPPVEPAPRRNDPPPVEAAPRRNDPPPVEAAPVALLRLARPVVEHARGAAATLTGTLRTAAGNPIAGARLTVAWRDMGADADARDGTATVGTNAAGEFSFRLRRDGAQRVSISWQRAVSSAIVRTPLALRATPSRRRLPEGATFTLSGRLRGAGASTRGTLVQIQSIVRGRWRSVDEVRARADGTYRWRYRFLHLTRDTVFSLRAVVPHVPGWPWDSARSPTVRVRVDV